MSVKSVHTGWTIVGKSRDDLFSTPRRFIYGILYEPVFRSKIESLLGIRSLVYRTRQQARERKRGMWKGGRVAKVKVTVEVIEYD